jgi:hypothetical protein
VPRSELPLKDLASRHPGLTEVVAGSFLEAARVCLDRHHSSPTHFRLRNHDSEADTRVEWETTDDRCRGAWANAIDTTEAGAYACIIAAVEVAEGLIAVRRAETGTGADYYLAAPGHEGVDLETALRLEVSGLVGALCQPSSEGFATK